MRRGTKIGFALLALLTLTAAGCDERPFTRDYARSVPNSVIQVGEHSGQDLGVCGRGMAYPGNSNTCEDLSPWNVAYSCKSPDGTVELTFNDSNTACDESPRSTSAAKQVPLYCVVNPTDFGATR